VVTWQIYCPACRHVDGAREPCCRCCLSPRTALDVLDELLSRRDLRVEFDLKPGDMYFINNRWVLHNRTAFEDHPEPERRRHLVRLWLQATPEGGV